jgi:hypothetical protein
METEKKALYNSLRMNWIHNPGLKVHPWQVEDLRLVEVKDLLERLTLLGASFDPVHFMALAENYETPEEFADSLFGEQEAEEADEGFLIVFELWRRWLPEKQSLSLFCDELDHQIHLYDAGEIGNNESLHDTIGRLLQILNENADAGIKPADCMKNLAAHSAHDLESFLYDYLSQEIEEGNLSWARDFVEGFTPFVTDPSWFNLLDLKVKVEEGQPNLEPEFKALLKKSLQAPLDFYLEVMDLLTRYGDEALFAATLKKMLPLAENEADLYDISELAADFFHFLDDENKENRVLALLKKLNRDSGRKLSHPHPGVRDLSLIVFGSP